MKRTRRPRSIGGATSQMTLDLNAQHARRSWKVERRRAQLEQSMNLLRASANRLIACGLALALVRANAAPR
jgi:hypothetical protein